MTSEEPRSLSHEIAQLHGGGIVTMSAHDIPGMTRRTFINAGAAGLGAASVAALAADCTGTGREAGGAGRGSSAATGGGPPAGRGLADTVLEAFQTHRLVGLGEAHNLQNHHDALTLLLTDLRLPGAVNDIVVEFGNALYQDTIDRFISGQPVDNADLRLVWRNTTQSPLATWDEPVYEQFFRTVRAVNAPLPPSKQIHVLLGDPPLDWPRITSFEQLRAIAGPQRDTHAASVVETQVLSNGHRALLCYGTGHLTHGGSLAGLIERRTGQRPYLIADFVPLAGDPGGLARKFSRYSRDTVIPTAGTWLGSVDAGLFSPDFQPGPNGAPQANPECGVRLGSHIDAALYLGQAADLTSSWWNPAIFLDPLYWHELQRRNALQRGPDDLNSYRQQDLPARFPLTRLPASRECGKAS
jgi:hypothetical protein